MNAAATMDAEALAKAFTPKAGKPVNADRQLCWCRYSPDGKLLLAGDYDAVIRRWNMEGEEPQELKPITGHHGRSPCTRVNRSPTRPIPGVNSGRLGTPMRTPSHSGNWMRRTTGGSALSPSPPTAADWPAPGMITTCGYGTRRTGS